MAGRVDAGGVGPAVGEVHAANTEHQAQTLTHQGTRNKAILCSCTAVGALFFCPIHLVEVDGVPELEPLAVLLTSRQLGQQPPHLQHIIHIHKSQVTNLSRKLHLSPHSGPELVPWSPLVHCRGHGQASAVTIDSEWGVCSHNQCSDVFIQCA